MSGGDGGRSWSDLPADVITEIMERLEVVDFIRLSSTSALHRSLSRSCRPKNQQIPWMMLSSPQQPELRFFYCLTDQKIYKIHLPQIAGLHTVGSCEGFLITVDQFGELQTLNPLTGSELFPIPSTSTHHDIASVIRNADGEVIEYIRELKGKQGSVFRIELDLDFMRWFYRTAIISPSLDKIVVIKGGHVQQLAFARAGDTSWTLLPFPSVPSVRLFSDAIFHKGRLYAIDISGTIAIFDLDSLEPPFIPNPRSGPVFGEGASRRRFLVESPDGHGLFLVLEVLDDKNYKVPKTTGFVVFKLDKIKFEWEKVESIGEIAMFLGFNYSIAYSIHDFPSLKGNAIYFTYDDCFNYLVEPECEGKGDSGVFNLEDRSIQLLCPSDDLQHNWPPAVWFTPILR